jgi:hypothetical protein
LKFTAATKEAIRGNPADKYISTSFVERQNLTMRMSMRASLYAPDSRVQQKSRKSRGNGEPILHVLQLRPGASDAPRDARDGSRHRGSRLVR